MKATGSATRPRFGRRDCRNNNRRRQAARIDRSAVRKAELLTGGMSERRVIAPDRPFRRITPWLRTAGPPVLAERAGARGWWSGGQGALSPRFLALSAGRVYATSCIFMTRSAGTVTVTVVPSPMVLRSSRVPPCSSIRLLARGRPMPAPSTWPKRPSARGMSSGAMPSRHPGAFVDLLGRSQ